MEIPEETFVTTFPEISCRVIVGGILTLDGVGDIIRLTVVKTVGFIIHLQ